MTVKKEVFHTVWLVFSMLSVFALEEVPWALNIMLGYVYLVFPALLVSYTLTLFGVRIPVIVNSIQERGELFFYELPFTMMVCGVFFHLNEIPAMILTILVTMFGTMAHREITNG